MYEELNSRLEPSRVRNNGAACLVLAGLLLLSGCSSGLSNTPPAEPGVGPEPTASADDWCAGHGLPESMCTKCNPELTAGFKAAGDWCAEHGLPESACPLCKPRVR